MAMENPPLLSTGIGGLDNILHGGLAKGFVYLIEGDPGAGKTTLALQFLMQGAAKGEKGLFISLAESEVELRQMAVSHGFTFDNITIAKLSPPELAGSEGEQYTVFQPAEVELADVLETILEKVREVGPSRVVIDSMSELRMLARDSLRYRRQVLTLKQFFEGRDCTILLLDERIGDSLDGRVQTIAHGVISLDSMQREYGITRRRLEIRKLRGSSFREGFHDYIIVKGGLRVFPRLISGEHRGPAVPQETLPSGIAELDALFHGGVQRGTSTLIAGPAGCGKSTIGAQFAYSAAVRQERSAIFNFDETRQSYLDRSRGLGMDFEPHLQSNTVHLEQVDPAELAPGEFMDRIYRGVVDRQWRVVIIDSLNGLMISMGEESALTVQLHEVLSYLNQSGVATFLMLAQYGVLGPGITSPADLSYLADNVLLLRYFEAGGEVRQALSVVKRRSGPHERSLRELKVRRGKLSIGEPLKDFSGVLTGTPVYNGGQALL